MIISTFFFVDNVIVGLKINSLTHYNETKFGSFEVFYDR